MYCSFCKSTEHEIRNYKAQNAPIVCPVLLACKCTYCGKSGHKINKCSLKIKDERNARHQTRRPIEEKPSKKTIVKVNRFVGLMDDSDDEYEDKFESTYMEEPIPLPVIVKEKITGKRKGDWTLMMEDSDSEDEE